MLTMLLSVEVLYAVAGLFVATELGLVLVCIKLGLCVPFTRGRTLVLVHCRRRERSIPEVMTIEARGTNLRR